MNVLSGIRVLPFFVALLALGGSDAGAQQEVDPDHFDSPNTDVRYEGRFALPYSVLCSGNRLTPGQYTISLRSDGKVGEAILNRKGRAVGITGVVHRQAHKRVNNALIVEDKGKIRTLSAIQLAELDFVFDPQQQIDSSPKSKPRRFQRLPLTLLAPKRRQGMPG